MSKVGNVISKYGDALASQNPEDNYHITGNDLNMGQLKEKKDLTALVLTVVVVYMDRRGEKKSKNKQTDCSF